ncbi:hypothetical protein Acsp03_56080 [Actinomadura sp. NBRC 104412]|uniref:FadR/GntR family transcriptional regulator n=1 Tax=Actinomadura sp. NBRC 104412 TaxID=3032203 RepID=UPI0024A1986D|nr:GntR family transcriptional regulator [Actinomadura sp. NBRC 104412]GLZ08142.1 hypothetical protein Acsp03_56080 [Actinomadura sp. NBRC 104412]
MKATRDRGAVVLPFPDRRCVDPSLFVPAHPVRLLDDVIAQLRAAMVDGRLPPGSRLPDEAELARQFMVDKGIVRDALRAVRRAGLVRARADETGGIFYIVIVPAGW